MSRKGTAMIKQIVPRWVPTSIFTILVVAAALGQPGIGETSPPPEDDVLDQRISSRCGANSVFVASALLGHTLPLSRCAEVVPPRRVGNTMAELKQGFERLGFDISAVTIRPDDFSGLQGTFVIWIPPGVEIRTIAGERFNSGHFVVLHCGEDEKWLLLDYLISARAIEPATWLAAILSEHDLTEAPMLVVSGEPKPEFFAPAEIRDRLPVPSHPGELVVSEEEVKKVDNKDKTLDTHAITPEVDHVETDLLLDDIGSSLYRARLDFGTRHEGEQLKGRVSIWNALDVPMELTDIQTTCGCTASVLSQSVIQPGGGAVLDVSLNLIGRVGQVRQSVSLLAKVENRDIPVFIECSVESQRQWMIRPKSVAFGSISASGGPVQQVIKVKAAFPGIAERLILARSTSSQITASIQFSESKPDEGMYSVLVIFTPDGLSKSYFTDELYLFGEDSITAEVTIPVTAKVME